MNLSEEEIDALRALADREEELKRLLDERRAMGLAVAILLAIAGIIGGAVAAFTYFGHLMMPSAKAAVVAAIGIGCAVAVAMTLIHPAPRNVSQEMVRHSSLRFQSFPAVYKEIPPCDLVPSYSRFACLAQR